MTARASIACRRRPDRSRASARFHFDGEPLAGYRRRYARFRAARVGRDAGRPLLQISPPARRPDRRAPRSRTRWWSCARGARREPNTRATTVELFDGLEATSQNRWPSLRFDLGAINSLFSPLLVAGFYYKTFMWPAAFWEKLYEPLIRRAAGLGRASGQPIPTTTRRPSPSATCWSSAAARRVWRRRSPPARAGARVILCDEDFRARRPAERRATGDRRPCRRAMGRGAARRARGARRTCAILTRTTVFGVYDGGVYGALERVSDHLADAAAAPAASAALADRGEARGARRRRGRAADRRSAATTGRA